MRLRQSLIAFLLILALGFCTHVRADQYWDSNGIGEGGSDSDTATGTWGSDDFWGSEIGDTATGPWIADETAVFSAGTDVTGTYTVTVSGTQSASGIRFEEGAVSLDSGTVDLTNAATVTVGTSLTATINSVISGAAGMTQAGTGMLVLNGANNYSGNTMLASNTNLGTFNILRVGANEVIPNDSILQIEGQNSVFDLNGKTETVKSIATINTGAGALANSRFDIGTGTLILDDEIGETSVVNGQFFAMSTGKIIKDGGGRINLSATSSAWDGEFVLNDGILSVSVGNALGTTGSSTARLTLNGGTLAHHNNNAISLQTQNVDITGSFAALVTTNFNFQLIGSAGSVAITLKTDNPTISVSNTTEAGTGAFIFAGPVNDEGQTRGFTKAGPGQLTLAHASNTFTGDVTVLEGYLAVNNVGVVGNGSNTIHLSGGHFGVSQAARTTPVTNPINITAAGTSIAPVPGATGPHPVLEFSNANIGGTGSLLIDHRGSACATPHEGNMCVFDATFSAPGLNFSLDIEIDNGATFGNGNMSVSRFNSGNTSGSQTYSGVISGVGRFRRSVAGGSTTLTGANTYSGGTQVEGGTLTVSGTTATLGTGDVTVTGGTLDVAMGVANAIADTATLSISGTGIVNLGASIDDLIAGLMLDGMAQASGTYGSSASSATFQFDQWFSGTGIVTIPVAGLTGDFNEDGKVDAADYITWRKNDGTNNALPNDNGLGTPIGSAHYDLWTANFGNMAGSGGGSGATAAVPEPTSLGLLTLAAGLALTGCSRRSRRLG